ncbi:hypothetical protein CEUSTIGMA_g7517.t1 [Chlamydomonas eustigma]|uniref:Uncharacterized protein n=1 Tax=Chlamydomonas eustigma TaxID=1157962 RepID=A0A250XB12_9CHLO|nr:hypothetical protein CEUSTIGMA_g7517.t1 [Chlamydomonas eustigma]|eukprot:GAX80079.1 hypothetical protein CEUSTIGMA_g7517.t1 [Chlamydomonas eustigma]
MSNPYEYVGKPWSSSLFNCFQDIGICLLGTVCRSVLYSQNVNTTRGGGRCGACFLYHFCCCCRCFFAGNHRGDLRRKYSLAEEPCNDCVVHCFCSCCAVCQEAREHKLQEAFSTSLIAS